MPFLGCHPVSKNIALAVFKALFRSLWNRWLTVWICHLYW